MTLRVNPDAAIRSMAGELRGRPVLLAENVRLPFTPRTPFTSGTWWVSTPFPLGPLILGVRETGRTPRPAPTLSRFEPRACALARTTSRTRSTANFRETKGYAGLRCFFGWALLAIGILRRFTRLTNGFSKKLANLKAMVDVFFVWYNFCRVHGTIRMTPAMEAGWTDHVWTMRELLGCDIVEALGKR